MHNNNQDDIYSAVIMTEVIARFHSVQLVNVEQRQAAAEPQTELPDLGYKQTSGQQNSSFSAKVKTAELNATKCGVR